MRRWLAIAALLLTAFFVGMCVRTYGVPGQTQNGGYVVTVPGFSGGVEIWGTPGVFNCNSGGC